MYILYILTRGRWYNPGMAKNITRRAYQKTISKMDMCNIKGGRKGFVYN